MSIKSLIETIKKDGILRASGILEELYKLATENEAQLTALTTQLESVVAENAALKELIEQHAGSVAVCPNCSHEEPSETDDIVALYRSMETAATDAFLAEVRASGVEMYAENLDSSADDAERDGFDDAVKFLRSEASAVRLFAAQLRQGGAV